MAYSVILQNATYTLTLSDSTAGLYGLQVDGALGMPQAERIYSQSWGRGFSPLAAIDYRSREIKLILRLQGTSLDNWVVNFRQVEAVLLQARLWWTTNQVEGDAATLSVQLNGMTYPLEFDVLDGECNADKIFDTKMLSQSNPQLLQVEVPLRVKPFGHPQALTSVTSIAFLNGGGVSATNPGADLISSNGDVPAPLKVTFQAASGDDFRRVIIGKKIGITTAQFPFALNCETGTGPGYTVTSGTTFGGVNTTVAAVATAHGGNVARVDITSSTHDTATAHKLINWEITSGLANWYGKYRVFLRISGKSFQGASGFANWQWWYGGASGDDIKLTGVSDTPTSDGAYLRDLGVMHVPHRNQPFDAPLNSFKMSLAARMASGAFDSTGHIDPDCVYFMPIDGGFFDGQLSANAASSGSDQIVIDALQSQAKAYVLDSSGDLQPEKVTPYTNTYFVATPGVNNLFYVLMMDNTSMSHDLSDAYTLKGEYHPQFVLGRTTT